MNVALIGSGNVATWIAQRLQNCGDYKIAQVFSRNIGNAERVAQYSGAQAIDDIRQLSRNCGFYVFALSDGAYDEILPQLPFRLPSAFLTSGTVSCQIFKQHADSYGVIYPLQTFTKTQDMHNFQVPLCLESDFAAGVKSDMWDFAKRLSPDCREVSERQRAQLHVAAVFACNFSNAMCSISYNLLKDNGLDFNILLPLLKNTVSKLETLTPMEAQTGPAVRGDRNVMDAQISSLKDEKLKNLYKIISEIICEDKA